MNKLHTKENIAKSYCLSRVDISQHSLSLTGRHFNYSSHFPQTFFSHHIS